MAEKFTANQIWPLVKQSGSAWVDDNVPSRAAALAYYMAVSLAPLIIITIKIVAIAFGRDAAATQLKSQLASLTDPTVADAASSILAKAGQPGNGTIATIISIGVALVGASGVFGELQTSLNAIWRVQPKPGRGIWGMLSDRFLSMTMVLGSAFLLLVSMFISTLITGVSGSLIHAIFGTDGMITKVIAFSIDLVLSTGIVAVLFAAIFRFLPDVKIGWKDVWLGALVTAGLFQIGKYLLSFYLIKASPGSAYGLAGSLVAFLVWVYYSAQILFFGAEFTRMYGNRFGTRIVPSENAEPVGGENCAPGQVPAKAARGKPTPAQPKPRKPRPIPHRRLPHVVPTLSPVHRNQARYFVMSLPVFTGVVLGRFAWKQYHRLHPTPLTLKQRWSEAVERWKDVIRSFGHRAPRPASFSELRAPHEVHL